MKKDWELYASAIEHDWISDFLHVPVVHVAIDVTGAQYEGLAILLAEDTQAIDVVDVLRVSLLEFDRRAQFDVRVEVHALVHEAVARDLGLAAVLDAGVEHLSLRPFSTSLLVHKWDLVITRGDQSVCIDEHHLKVRIAIVQQLLGGRLILGALADTREVHEVQLAVLRTVAQKPACWGEA